MALPSQEYLKRHQIPELVDAMVGRLIAEQPACPRAFLAAMLLRRTDGSAAADAQPSHDGAAALVPLRCAVQHYAWGMRGGSSEVAQLHSAGTGDPVADKPYAELWMGTHPSGPSMVGATPLRDWIAAAGKAAVLGKAVAAAWGDLPFLFKVLSVSTALSIQAHPDKPAAELLHARDPQNYKDDNHKPEMAVALTPFEALCGFVAPPELRAALTDYPELRRVVGGDAAAAYERASAGGGADGPDRRGALRAAFRSLMTAEKGAVAAAVRDLTARLRRGDRRNSMEGAAAAAKAAAKEQLLLRLDKQYPGDVGVLGALFLNHITLRPGEAMYLPANEPHAYVSGNIVECMAASDNVVRAGLTPKFIDTDTLVGMLTYKQGPPPILLGDPVDGVTRRYVPPFEEFEVQVSDVPAGAEYLLAPVPGPSILLCTEGGGGALHAGGAALPAARGLVAFAAGGAPVLLSAAGRRTVLIRATVNAAAFAAGGRARTGLVRGNLQPL